MKRFNIQHNLQVNTVLLEVARVLKPGGIAFLDDEEELSGEKSKHKRQDLANKLNVILEAQESIHLFKIGRNFPKFWNNDKKLVKFLVMQKFY